MRRTGRISPSLATTVEAGESLMGDPLRNPLTAKLDLSENLWHETAFRTISAALAKLTEQPAG